MPSGSDCTRCGGRSFYTRRYSGEVLCAACFQDVDRREDQEDDLPVRDAAPRREGRRRGLRGQGQPLPAPRPPRARRGRGGTSWSSLTVDEGVKGYREESIEHSAGLTKELGLEQVVVSYKELYGFDLDHGTRLEGRARGLVLQHVRRLQEARHRRGRPPGGRGA